MQHIPRVVATRLRFREVDGLLSMEKLDPGPVSAYYLPETECDTP
jgi:hypothetical protein